MQGRQDGTNPCLPKDLMRAHLPDKRLFIGKQVPSRPDLFVQDFVGSGNDGHVFRAHSQDLQRDFACKVIPRANLAGGEEGPPRWRTEVEKANSLRSPVVVRFVDIKDWVDQKAEIDCVV